jgi:thiosulfate reductase cytochrome b subunit
MTRETYPKPEPLTPAQRLILFTLMVVGVVSAGIAFAYKIAEFLFTITADEVQGFADVPVVVYFAVAAGWLALLVWSFLTGKLRDMEDAKSDFLRKEEEYERLGL